MPVIHASQSSVDLLAAVVAIQRKFTVELQPHAAFEAALALLLELSGSEFGFVGEILRTDDGSPYLKVYATTDFSADKDFQAFYDKFAPAGMEFYNQNNLMGEVFRTGQIVISNDPATDVRSGGLPPGHPTLDAFLGLPFVGGSDELVGMAGLANRPGGYDLELADALRPLCDMLGVLIVAARKNREQREMESALRASEARYRAFVDHATAGLYMHDAEGRVVDVNRQACEALGYERDELIGMMPIEFDPDLTQERHDWFIAQLDKSSETITFDARHRHKNGTVFPVEVRLRPFWVEGHRFVLSMCRDITERKQAEEKLRDAQQRLSVILKGADVGLWDWDLITSVVNFSSEWKSQLGYADHEVTGHYKEFESRVHPEDLPPTLLKVQTAIRDYNNMYEAEFRMRHKNGSWRWILARGFVITDDNSVPTSMLGIHVDITERKATEAALLKSEQRLRDVIEHMPVMFCAADDQAQVAFWNKECERVSGFPAEQIVGSANWENILGAAHDARRTKTERRGKYRGKYKNWESTLTCRDGTVRTIAWANTTESPHIPGWSRWAFGIDVTDKTRAEVELAVRHAELLHASRLTTVGQMVAALSHEVAQPLSAVGNFAAASDQLLHNLGDEKLETLHTYVRAILKQNQRCSAILQRLRDFSRRASTRRTNCDVLEMVSDAVELVANELRQHDIRLATDLQESLPEILGDRVQLQQMIVNLLTNARDAVLGQHGDRRAISLRAFSEGNAIVVEVEDFGAGFSPDAAARMFEPFYTTKETGMGIGLSICQSIVADHGGRIQGSTNADGGATFRVTLPIPPERAYD